MFAGVSSLIRFSRQMCWEKL